MISVTNKTITLSVTIPSVAVTNVVKGECRGAILTNQFSLSRHKPIGTLTAVTSIRGLYYKTYYG